MPADGVYVLEKALVYTILLPSGHNITTLGRATLEIRGAAIDSVGENKDGEIRRANGTLNIDGVNLTTHKTCESPQGGDSTAGPTTFTASADAFVMYTTLNVGDSILERTYVKK